MEFSEVISLIEYHNKEVDTMINRTEIEKKVKEASGGLTEVLDELLSDVKADDKSTVTVADTGDEVVERLRNELVNGGFGDDEVEDPSEIEIDRLESFFVPGGKKYYQMDACSDYLKKDGSEYEVFGIYRNETGKYYLLFDENHPCKEEAYINTCGLIVSEDHFLKLQNNEVVIKGYDFVGGFVNNGWVFYRTDAERSNITLNVFDMVLRLYSRNTGLLESSEMNTKTALIIGSGSVGSLIALELARAGVGHFVLVDGDILEVHNICRHQLGFRDLGRYKVDAVADAIRNINPSAEIIKFRGLIQEMPDKFLENFKEGIVIGTGDNRESSAIGNDLAKVLNVPFVSTGCWERAHAGECFYWFPDSGLPTYREVFANLLSDERPEAHQNYFADDDSERPSKFEPGISTDISWVTLVAVKEILDLLNKDSQNYTPRVIGYLTNYTLVCNTNETAIGGGNAAIFPHPLFISHTIHAGMEGKEVSG